MIKKIFPLLGILSSSVALAAGAKHVPGEIVVKYKNSASSENKQSLGFKVRAKNRSLFRKDSEIVKINENESIDSAIQIYQDDPSVEYAEPNYILETMQLPNDQLLPQQWGLKNTAQTVSASYASTLVPNFTGWHGSTWNASIGAANPGLYGRDIGIQPAWDLITDCRNNRDDSPVVVGVIDTGINYNHPDLANNMWDGGTLWPNHGKNSLSADTNGDVLTANDPMDQNGHGTGMASIIAAQGNNTIGTSGVCWRARLMASKGMNWKGSGSMTDIAAAVDYGVANGAKVLNLSLGVRTASMLTLENSIINAKNSGVLIITAAGNDAGNNDTSTMLPCNYSRVHDNVICVAAVDQSATLGAISAYGSTTVQIGAPGINIVTLADGYISTSAPLLGAAETLSQWKYTDQNGTPVTDWRFTPYNGSYAILGGSYPGTGTSSIGSLILQLGMVNPTTFSFTSPGYSKNANHRAWNTVGTKETRQSIYDLFNFCYYRKHSLASGDSVEFGYRPSTTMSDPFSGTATVLETLTGSGETFACNPAHTCLDSRCNYGFRSITGSNSGTTQGAFFTHMRTAHKTPDQLTTAVPTTNVSSGTSDATAFVSGVATMLYAYNGNNFNYLDVKNAIFNGGATTATLANYTTTSKMLNAIGALSYIQAPQNVQAVNK